MFCNVNFVSLNIDCWYLNQHQWWIYLPINPLILEARCIFIPVMSKFGYVILIVCYLCIEPLLLLTQVQTVYYVTDALCG